MIGFFCSAAILLGIQVKTPSQSMIRFTGRDGGYETPAQMLIDLKKIPSDPPNPKVLAFHSVVFEEPQLMAIFDRSYRPLRSIFAKIDLVNLLVENGPNRVYRITQLPFSLYDEMIEALDYAIPNYVCNSTTVMSVSLGMDTKIQLPRTFLSASQAPSGADEITKKNNLAALDKDPMWRDDGHAQMVKDRELYYAKLPVVKIYANHRQKYSEFSANEKRSMILFDNFVQKETFNADQRLFDYLDRMNVWSDKSAIFRSKTFGDLAAKAPSAYQNYMTTLSESYSKHGYSNEDAFRRDLSNATTNSTMTFIIQVGLGEGKTASFPFL